MLSILFWLLVGYFAFRFVVGFLVPMIRTTRQVRRSFREMNQRMNEHFGGPADPRAQAPDSGPPPAKGDYIDFEEIKE